MHHASIRTADIRRAIAFYEQLGFEVCERFTAGITLACWLEGRGVLDGRIELIEIPAPKPAPDAFGDEHYVGYYHLSFDLGDRVESLPDWLDGLQSRFETAPDLSSLKVLLEPQQQQIGESVYEVAFVADTDGLPLEFLRCLNR